MPDHFNIAFSRTMAIEGDGELSNDSMDPGGMTFSGISRVYWPEWDGWPLVDKWVEDGCGKIPTELTEKVKVFYRVNFWNLIRGDALAAMAPAIAYEVFDTAVNVGRHYAVSFLQSGHNIGRGNSFKDLVVDGVIGQKTLEAIGKFLRSMPGTPELNKEILLNCMNGEQYIFYKNNPKSRYFRGWFCRV